MSDTIPMDAPGDPRKGDAGVSDSARKCTGCGQLFSGVIHDPCPASDKTIKDPPSAPTSPKGTLDDLPQEVSPHAGDAARQLNHYVLVEQVGKGGMGAVWKAWDRKLTRWVAIKFLLAEDREGIDRFGREAKLAARLRHPNIAAIYEVGEAPSREAGKAVRHYLAMEYIDGQTLVSASLSRPQQLDLFIKVARAIDAAHKGGVVHRDLKPANIMVTRDLWPYVMDFGLAKALETDSSLSVSGTVMGTPSYMPPEQAEGRLSEIDARSDIYSLAATLYFAMLGRAPYEGQSVMEILRKVSTEPIVPPRKIDPDFPAEIESILLKAMARDRQDRYPSAAAFADDLARIFEGRRPLTPVVPESRSGRGKAGLITVALLAIVGAGGALLGPRVLRELRPSPAVSAVPPAALPANPPPDGNPDAEALPPPSRRPVPFRIAAPDPGLFSLTVAVYPYAQIARMTCDGKAVALAQTNAPLLIPKLEVGDYVILLRHPQLGERTVTLSRSQIKPGKSYAVWGRMDKASLEVKELP